MSISDTLLTDSLAKKPLFIVKDSFPFPDSVKVILKVLDSLMSDSLSQKVILNEKPYVPGRDGFIIDDLQHFMTNMQVYDFGNINVNISDDEMLKLRFESLKAFDTKLNFNVFRYMPARKGLVLNYYRLLYLTYHDVEYPSISKNRSKMFSNDTLPDILSPKSFYSIVGSEMDAWSNVRKSISFSKPGSIDIHWKNMPDPPLISDTIYMPIIRRSNLGDDIYSRQNRDIARKISGYNRQQKSWEFIGYTALHANQTLFKNWAKGGESSISMLGIGRFSANYNANGVKWENELEVKLGALKQFEGLEELVKNDDQLKFSSKVGYKAFANWFYTANFDFNTQFFYGYDIRKKDLENPISGFLSPARTYLSLGMDYKYKKKFLSVFISPLTLKHTLVADTAVISAKRYGIEEGKKSNTEAGAYIKGALIWEINSEMRLQSKIYLFSNYSNKPQNIDVDWEGEFEYKFSHVFALRFGLNLKYDDDQQIMIGTDEDGKKIFSKRLQVKQLMSIGISYRF